MIDIKHRALKYEPVRPVKLTLDPVMAIALIEGTLIREMQVRHHIRGTYQDQVKLVMKNAWTQDKKSEWTVSDLLVEWNKQGNSTRTRQQLVAALGNLREKGIVVNVGEKNNNNRNKSADVGRYMLTKVMEEITTPETVSGSPCDIEKVTAEVATKPIPALNPFVPQQYTSVPTVFPVDGDEVARIMDERLSKLTDLLTSFMEIVNNNLLTREDATNVLNAHDINMRSVSKQLSNVAEHQRLTNEELQRLFRSGKNASIEEISGLVEALGSAIGTRFTDIMTTLAGMTQLMGEHSVDPATPVEELQKAWKNGFYEGIKFYKSEML